MSICVCASVPCVGGEIPSGPETLTYVSPYTTDSGEPALRVWRIAEDFLRLDYFDGMQFWLDRNGSTIWADWPDTLFVEDAATYLLGPVLGIVLRMRGVTCLHASAVAFGNSVAAFVGSAGFGKSTTAAALARHGHSVVSDDIVALVERDGAFFVLPAYPYLCLWPDSVSILFGAEKRLPSFSPTWDKRQLTLSEHRLRFERQSLPLGAIFLLGERSADPAAPHLEPVLPRESLLSLVADSYATNLLDKKMRANEFELARPVGRHRSGPEVAPSQRPLAARPSMRSDRSDMRRFRNCAVLEHRIAFVYSVLAFGAPADLFPLGSRIASPFPKPHVPDSARIQLFLVPVRLGNVPLWGIDASLGRQLWTAAGHGGLAQIFEGGGSFNHEENIGSFRVVHARQPAGDGAVQRSES